MSIATNAWAGTYEELPLGTEETASQLIDGAAIDAFADAIKSYNPVHMDGNWARKNTHYPDRIAHGVMTTALMSQPLVQFCGFCCGTGVDFFEDGFAQRQVECAAHRVEVDGAVGEGIVEVEDPVGIGQYSILASIIGNTGDRSRRFPARPATAASWAAQPLLISPSPSSSYSASRIHQTSVSASGRTPWPAIP